MDTVEKLEQLFKTLKIIKFSDGLSAIDINNDQFKAVAIKRENEEQPCAMSIYAFCELYKDEIEELYSRTYNNDYEDLIIEQQGGLKR